MNQENVKTMRVMVTGAGGFIGGTLAVRLQGAGGCDVVALSRSVAPDGLTSGIRWVQCDPLKELPLDDRVDYIVHCAALQDYRHMPVKDFIDCNRTMTEQVAAYGRKVGVQGIIFTSSISLHGQISTNLVDEHTEIINPSPYGLSKQMCEHLLLEQSADVPVVALRLCGVVGVGAKDIWLSRVLRSARRGEPVEIHNADSLFNNVLHTDDLAGFVQNLMGCGFTGFSAFPLASGRPMTIRDVAEKIISASGSSSNIVDKGATGNPYLISNEYATKRFGYVPSEVITNLIKYVCST
jgi:UDP-glucose 4-epimerase